jgi:hypothetical protein
MSDDQSMADEAMDQAIVDRAGYEDEDSDAVRFMYRIESLTGIVHFTDQETELGVFARKYGCIKVTVHGTGG